MSDREKHKVVLPIGPQHPSLKEPGSFKITLDGEKVERAVVEIGYNHRVQPWAGPLERSEGRRWLRST